MPKKSLVFNYREAAEILLRSQLKDSTDRLFVQGISLNMRISAIPGEPDIVLAWDNSHPETRINFKDE